MTLREFYKQNPSALLTFLPYLLALIIVWTGCQNNSKPAPITGSDNLRYFHDERTGLCFAAMNSQIEGYASTSITNVPCTDKVTEIIHQ